MVRKSVPEELRPVLGRRELLRSLGTGDVAVAVKLYPAVWDEFTQKIAEARGIKTAKAAPPLDTLPAEIALSKWAGLVTSNPSKWLVPGATQLATSPSMLAMIRGHEAFFETGDRSLLPDDSISDLPPLPEMTRRMLNLGGMRVAPGHPIIAEMERKASLHIAMAFRYIERERLANSVKQIDLDEVGAVDMTVKLQTPPSIKLSELYRRWKATLEVADKEVGRLDHQQRRLIETIGDLPANHVDNEMISTHMSLVSRFPGRKRSAALAALETPELVEQFERENAARSDAEKHGTLSVATVSEWFSGYSRMFDYGVTYKLIPSNPMNGLKRYVVRGAEGKDRRAYSAGELGRLFAAPLFRGFDPTAPKGSRSWPGSTITKDAKYWLPIICLLHGARLSEVAAMPLEHVRHTEDGTWYFDLTDRTLKTTLSQRLIPMHPRLLGLDFIAYVEALREAEERWLFPELKHTTTDGPGHYFSKWYGRWSRNIGLTDRRTSFHSFRHNWKRRARETAAVKEEMHDVLSGHVAKTVSRSYGDGADITPLARDMALLEFPELTL